MTETHTTADIKREKVFVGVCWPLLLAAYSFHYLKKQASEITCAAPSNSPKKWDTYPEKSN